jgi:hypothetical protein
MQKKRGTRATTIQETKALAAWQGSISGETGDGDGDGGLVVARYSGDIGYRLLQIAFIQKGGRTENKKPGGLRQRRACKPAGSDL